MLGGSLALPGGWGGVGSRRGFDDQRLGGSVTSTRPASIDWPPPVWWQWMAIRFLPGLRVALASAEMGRST